MFIGEFKVMSCRFQAVRYFTEIEVSVIIKCLYRRCNGVVNDLEIWVRCY